METVLTGAAANVSSEAAKGIFQEIKRHMRYVIIYKKNVDKFEEKLKMLMAKRTTVQQQVDAADRNGEKIKEDVEFWRNTVDKVINEEEKKVKDLEDKAKNKCFTGLCPNIKSRYQLSKKAEEGTAAVEDLIQQCTFNGVGYRDVLEAPKCAAPTNFKAFDSRKEVFDGVMEALKDSTISMIGVYGTGGVGKTTLVNQVSVQVQEDELFGWVVKATVTQVPNIEKIQDEIAESLLLKLQDKTIPARARSLSERLKKEKKILVVLDDVWARLDLEQVGIPFGDQHKGCKILLTSRNRDVLTNEMDAKKAFIIDGLKETEAWDLFKRTVENDFEDPELRFVATEVAKKCEGLPVAIVTVARALKSKDIHAWKDASRKLQKPSPSNFTGIPAAVYSAIELSYNYLESEELRQTFLLCGLLGHNARVEDLVRYGIGLRLFDNVDTVEDTRNRALTLVSGLKAFCLLRDSYSHDRFDMHDFDCDVALAIASRDNHAFALKLEGVFDDWPDEERMRKFKMISLSFDSAQKLPHGLECPLLDFFFMALQEKSYVHPFMASEDSDREMPASFFRGMENLKVLHLIKIKFSSVSLPTSLRTLCLNQCVLREMVNLGKLKNLEILNLSGSNIKMLPEETGQLTRLRLLDLSGCYNLKISTGVLSSLSKLEELYMGGSFHLWNEGSNARLDELRDLPCLTTLYACILDVKIVSSDLFILFAEKLKRYRIFIGNNEFWPGGIKFSRALKLKLNTNINQLDDGMQRLLMKSTAFYLENLEGPKIVFSEEGNREGLLHLKHIHIERGSEIQYIMKDNNALNKIEFRQLEWLILAKLPQLISFCSKNRSGASTSTPQHELALFGEEMRFPCLEKLQLETLKVEKIWPHQFSIISDYLQNLKSLSIQNCDNLKHILSYSVATSLTHLKSLEIYGCECLKEIMFMEDIEEDMMDRLFPKLELLKFQELPNLTRFCHGSNFEFPLLKKLIIKECPTFKAFISKSTMANEIHIIQEVEENNSEINVPHLFNEKMKFPCLEELQLYSFNVEEIWPNQFSITSDYLQNLTMLSIGNCDNLKHILSYSVATSLTHLKSFNINACECLKEIIFMEDIEEDMMDQIFPKLELLKLEDLPNLTRFCRGSNFEFPLLKELIIRDCPTFETVFSKSTMANEIHIIQEVEENNSEINVPHLFNEKMKFPCLEELQLYSLNVEKIWPNQFSTISDYLQNLTWLSIQYCDNLKHILSYSVATSLTHLKSFEIKGCGCLKEIMFMEDIEEDMMDQIFPKLELLKFEGLPNLTRFCHGSHFEFPLLKELIIEECPTFKAFISKSTMANEIHIIQEVEENNSEINVPHLFNEKMKFPCLEELQLYSLNVEKIWPNQFSTTSDYLQNLTRLSIQYCDNLKHILSYSVATSLTHLKSFEIKGCGCLKEIMFMEDIEEDMMDQIFPKLELLKFEDLPNLTRFCYGSHFEFPLLKKLIIEDCLAFETFFSKSTRVNEINIIQEAGKNNIKINFPSKWPSLKKMRVHQCDRVEIFASESLLSFGESTNRQPLFWVNEASFPNLEKLTLEENSIMKEIWHGQLRAECDEGKRRIVFPRLKYLELSYLPTLASFCSRDQIFEFPALEKMVVTDCPKMKIFCQGDLSTPQLQKVILRKYEDEEKGWWEGDLNTTIERMFEERVGYSDLRLSDASELMEIWSKNPQEILSFKYLKYLQVYKCSTLRFLFTLSMALTLPQLREIEVKNCTQMEHIIIDEGPHKQVSNKIVFPLLSFITLESCADLATFYQGSKILECPSLETFKVVDCPQMFAFASALSREQRIEMIDEGGNTTTLSKGIADVVFFDNMVAFPRLCTLVIGSMGKLRKIWDDKVTMNSFCDLQYLKVKDCERLSNIFPLNMMERLQKLCSLHIVNCDSLEEIIEPQGLNSNESHAVTATELRRSELPELTHLSKEEIPLGEVVFNNLMHLEVSGCGKLKNLMPSSTSFKDLISLKVSKCHGLMNLATLPLAKSMVLLEEMSITDCQMLEEIIASASDEVMDGIIFSKLWSLELDGLSSLSRFCSGNYMLGFPSLKKVIMRRCPKMEIFSKGELSTPMLHSILSTEDAYVGRWEGNLNATIQQLFKEENVQNCEETEVSF